MRKGQISAEFILVAVMVLTSAFMAFRYYQTSSMMMLSEATIKTSSDWELAKASLDHPECGRTYLAGFIRTEVSPSVSYEYEVKTTDAACTSKIFSRDVQRFINGSISVALGCDYDDFGECPDVGYVFDLHD